MVRIYGPMRSANGYAIRDFLHRSDIPFEWIELRDDLRKNGRFQKVLTRLTSSPEASSPDPMSEMPAIGSCVTSSPDRRVV